MSTRLSFDVTLVKETKQFICLTSVCLSEQELHDYDLMFLLSSLTFAPESQRLFINAFLSFLSKMCFLLECRTSFLDKEVNVVSNCVCCLVKLQVVEEAPISAEKTPSECFTLSSAHCRSLVIGLAVDLNSFVSGHDMERGVIEVGRRRQSPRICVAVLMLPKHLSQAVYSFNILIKRLID